MEPISKIKDGVPLSFLQVALELYFWGTELPAPLSLEI